MFYHVDNPELKQISFQGSKSYPLDKHDIKFDTKIENKDIKKIEENNNVGTSKLDNMVRIQII